MTDLPLWTGQAGARRFESVTNALVLPDGSNRLVNYSVRARTGFATCSEKQWRDWCIKHAPALPAVDSFWKFQQQSAQLRVLAVSNDEIEVAVHRELTIPAKEWKAYAMTNKLVMTDPAPAPEEPKP